MHIRLLIIFIYFLFLSGCIIRDREKYPTSWPSLQSDSLLKSRVGIYPGSLLNYLNFGKLIIEKSEGSSLVVTIDSTKKIKMDLVYDDKHDIPVLENSSQLVLPDSLKGHLRKLKAKDKKDYLLLIMKYDVQGGNPIAGFTRNYLKIYRFSEHEIIIRKGDYGGGLLFMLIPCYFEEYKWYKVDSASIH